MSQQLEKTRHSLSHILAMAVKELYPQAILGMGPATEEGFYYDFDKVKISEDDLPLIEKKMRELLRKKIAFQKEIKSKEEAQKIFKEEPYKLEIIQDIEESNVSLYRSGDFIDLCSGPHVESTEEIDPQSFKLDRIAGAYFKGSQENSMLQRIYGLAFEDKEQLEKYLERRKEAEKRDHRKLGKTLELFMFDEEVGQGLPLYLPKGGMLRYLLMNFAMDAYLRNGYEIVSTPHIARETLWEHSGHLKFYHDDMYGSFGVDDKNYRLKPMNCPFHVKMYNSRVRSYRELPLRWAEMGTVYRFEKSGELHGLTRPRAFTQDDAHIVCTTEQLKEEITKALQLTRYIYQTLGMESLIFKLSVRDPKTTDKYFGDDIGWQNAEKALGDALQEFGAKNYEIDEGGAVFYAPKIDIDAVDAMNRRWQLSTIQIDFNLPARFKMAYTDQTGKEKTPFMIHRALLGSIERFLGVYLEHTGGRFPLWISPEQAWIIPVSEKSRDYAEEIYKAMKEENIRAILKESDETLSKTIRSGEMQKIPYLLVVGEKEKERKEVSIRFNGEDKGKKSTEECIKEIKDNICRKSLR